LLKVVNDYLLGSHPRGLNPFASDNGFILVTSWVWPSIKKETTLGVAFS